MSATIDRFVYRPLGLLLTLFEDPTGTDRPLWRDYSYWQGTVNMNVAAQNGVKGMFSRAGIGLYYTDPTFTLNYAQAGAYGLYRSSYFVINPTQSVASQLAIWYDKHPTIDVVPRAIDLESSYGAPASQIADRVMQMSDLILEYDGIRPIIYTRYSLANSWLVPYWSVADLNEHWWWLAQYLYSRTIEHAGPPTRPTGVLEENIILHQTADKKADFPNECTSACADYDRWEIGDEVDMETWIAINWKGEQPPIMPPQPLGRVQIVAATLNIRTGPGTTYPDKGDTNAGQIWYFFEESNGWVKIGENNWISTGASYSTIIERY